TADPARRERALGTAATPAQPRTSALTVALGDSLTLSSALRPDPKRARAEADKLKRELAANRARLTKGERATQENTAELRRVSSAMAQLKEKIANASDALKEMAENRAQTFESQSLRRRLEMEERDAGSGLAIAQGLRAGLEARIAAWIAREPGLRAEVG